MQALAEALVKVGQLTEAASLADQCIALDRARGTRGLLLGSHWETRARVALATGDQPGFRAAAEGCGREYNLGRNRALTARYERLMRGAATRTWAGPAGRAQVTPGDTAREVAAAPAREFAARLSQCTGAEARANLSLQFLLEATRAEAGHLFGLRAGRLERLSSAGTVLPTAHLVESLDRFLQQEIANEARGDDVETQVSAERTLRDAGSELLFEPFVLVARQGGEHVVTGLAVLGYGAGLHPAPNPSVLMLIAETLLVGERARSCSDTSGRDVDC
jgi:hypothetical protein